MAAVNKHSVVAVAYHEAGHAVAAREYGLRIGEATIVAAEGYKGIVRHEFPLKGINADFNLTAHGLRKVERLILVCLAGPIAQRKWSPKSWRRWHGAGDFEQASDLAIRVHGSGDIASAYLKYLDVVATDFVTARWTMIELIAEALLARSQLSGSDIDQIIDNHYIGAMELTQSTTGIWGLAKQGSKTS